MAFNGEMTVNEAKATMATMWVETVNGMEFLADIEVPAITIQVMLAALCQDRITTARYRFDAQMDRFYNGRNLESAKDQRDVAKARECEAKAEELSAYLDEIELRLAYDREETKRINTALVARKAQVAEAVA